MIRVEVKLIVLESLEGASMELGYTFWQGAFKKNTKMFLDRAIFKPSIEVIKPRSRD